MKFRYIAFTLAEVLLVIAIIGVVATLTVPNLNKSYDKKAIIAQVKKEYSALNSAFLNIDSEQLMNGLSTDLEKSEALVKGRNNLPALKDYLSVSRYCGNSYSDCFAQNIKSLAYVNSYTVSDKNYQYGPDDNCYYFTLNDGADIAVCYYKKGSLTNVQTRAITMSTGMTLSTAIFFDANGASKGPNYLNFDIQAVFLMEDGSLYFPKLSSLDDLAKFDNSN